MVGNSFFFRRACIIGNVIEPFAAVTSATSFTSALCVRRRTCTDFLVDILLYLTGAPLILQILFAPDDLMVNSHKQIGPCTYRNADYLQLDTHRCAHYL